MALMIPNSILSIGKNGTSDAKKIKDGGIASIKLNEIAAARSKSLIFSKFLKTSLRIHPKVNPSNSGFGMDALSFSVLIGCSFFNYKFSITNYQLSMVNSQLPITAYLSLIINH